MITVEIVSILQQPQIPAAMLQFAHNSTRAIPFAGGIDDLHALQTSRVLLSCLAMLVICKYIYRMFFDQLSHIPGPKIAAATHLYEAYYNIVKTGYCKKLLRMHEEYGRFQSTITDQDSD